MDIRVLRYFVAVAQAESMTGAAEVLHTSQPNLSRQLGDLEIEVNKKLFEKSKRKIVLAEEGEFLFKRAQEIIALLERTEADLKQFDDVISGDVHISAAETAAMRLAAHAMQSLREKHPQILFYIFSGSTVEVKKQLDKGLLDYGIRVDLVDPQQYDYSRLPVNDIWGILMRKDSPLAECEHVRPEDIRDKPLLCSRQQLDAGDLSKWMGVDCKDLNIVTTFNLIMTPALMVEEGLGYAFTFDKLVDTTGERNLCFRRLEPEFETGLYLVWKKNQVFSKASKVFLEKMQETIRDDAIANE